MTDLVEVRRCPTHAQAEQLALVLAAVGIQSLLSPTAGAVGVYVSSGDAGRAREQLAVYERENAPRAGPSRAADGEHPHGLETAMAYGIVLLGFYVAERLQALGIDWTVMGAAQAGLITEGAWWRTVTSLTLHADLGHLLANLVFGMVAGVLLVQLLGAGLAWLGFLLAGGLGNALNAVLQASDHTAVGGSTGVFGVVGILAGYRQVSAFGGWGSGLRRWAPVAAGVMLLAFLGMGGERTDVLGHIAGFAVGGAVGLALAHAPRGALGRAGLQPLCGLLAGGLLALAWLLAVLA